MKKGMEFNKKSTKTQSAHQKMSKNHKIYKMKPNQLRTRLLKRKLSSRHTIDNSVNPEQTKEKQFIQSIDIDELNCPICLQLFVFPFSLRCDHTFCYMCLDHLSRFTSVNDCCPCCRNSIGRHYPARCRNIEKLLASIVSQRLGSDQKRNYLMRKAKALQELQHRAQQIKDVKLNQKIDFKVGNHWEEGRIIKIYTKEKKIKVQYMFFQVLLLIQLSTGHLVVMISGKFKISQISIRKNGAIQVQSTIKRESECSNDANSGIDIIPIDWTSIGRRIRFESDDYLQNFTSLRTESSDIQLHYSSSSLQ